jgi:hypothetical protein
MDAQPTEELYDLNADPKEFSDLIKARAQELRLGRFRSAIRQLVLDNRDAKGTVRTYMESLRRSLDSMNAGPPG